MIEFFRDESGYRLTGEGRSRTDLREVLDDAVYELGGWRLFRAATPKAREVAIREAFPRLATSLGFTMVEIRRQNLDADELVIAVNRVLNGPENSRKTS